MAGAFQSKWKAAWVILSMALGCQPAVARPAEFDEVARQLAETFSATWNAADGAGYGQAYWPDAELVDPSGMVWTGRDAIIQTHVTLWSHGHSTASATVRRVRPLSSSFMVVDITAIVCGFAQLPPGARPDAKDCVWSNLKHVVEKRGTDWKIIASQNTFEAPPAGE